MLNPIKPQVDETLSGYDLDNLTIATLGGHSGLDVCRGAKRAGFRTLAVCMRGREKTYTEYYRSRNGKGCVDDVILVDHFRDIVRDEVQEELRRKNAIMIHNRYFWVYCDWLDTERRFSIPIYGTRTMLKLEERDVPGNQYELLNQAGIRIPRIYDSPDEIDRLVIVKVAEASRGYERAFFYAASPDDYRKTSQEMLHKGIITEDAFSKAVIEEYIVGVHVNFNYFWSVIEEELEIMGTDTRRQTNLDGLLRLPAPQQEEVLKYLEPKYIESGHIACTTKESIIEKIFEMGEKFVSTTRKVHPPGMIGPFALQCAISAGPPKEEAVVFDVSMRIPGSPSTIFTPHSSYLYGDSISYGDRIAMEIAAARDQGRLTDICT